MLSMMVNYILFLYSETDVYCLIRFHDGHSDLVVETSKMAQVRILYFSYMP